MDSGLLATVAAALVLSGAGTANASTVIFPARAPQKVMMATRPAWLSGGSGDDGYVSVRASIIPPTQCSNLGTPGLLGGLLAIASEKVQIAVSLRTAGFSSTFNEVEVPIATFDARENPSTCWGLTKLPFPAISSARLEKFSAVNPGDLGVLVKVQSTSDVSVNLVSTAQMLGSVAAVFATGPAALNVGSANAMLAKPVLANLESSIDKAASRATNAESKPPAPYQWADIRAGIAKLTIPVYSGSSNWSENTEEAIARLQGDGQESNRTKLFDIVLDFSYSKSIFDVSLDGATDLPHGASIISSRVLNLPFSQTSNFLQLINSNSPSLQQTAASANTALAFTNTCQKINQILDTAGLDRIDRLIVTKAFMDESRGGGTWYLTPSNRFACFGADDINTALNMWDANIPFPTPDGSEPGNGTAYDTWARTALPFADEFAHALLLDKSKQQVLLNLNGGKDFELQYVDWADPSAQPPETDTIGRLFFHDNPGVWRLANKSIKKASCYAYFNDTSLQSSHPLVHMVVADDTGQHWRLVLAFNAGGTSVTRVQIFKLDNPWKTSFASTITDDSCKSALN